MAVRRVTRTGYGQNLKNKFAGVGVGFLLFLGAFVVLWLSQGQVNYSRIAKKSTEVSVESVDADMDGSFISATGILNSTESVGDPNFIKPGDYLSVERDVEVYAWVENTHTETRDLPGGKTETITTYTYSREWVDFVSDSDMFEERQYPANPKTMAYNDQTFTVSSASVGAFSVFPNYMTMPPAETPLSLSSDNVILGGQKRLEGNYIFQGSGSLSNPQIGDLRVSFTALENNVKATVFGEQSGNTIDTYNTTYRKDEVSLYRALLGDRDEAIATLKQEYKTLVLILTLIGFIMMWVGMTMMFGFIPALLKFLPFLKNISGFLIGVVTFLLALVLTIITVGIAFVAHNPIALILVIIILVVAGIIVAKKNKDESAPEMPAE